MIPVPEVRLIGDRFRTLAVLGQGGMGVVYLAQDLSSDQTVALKVLERRDSKALERFRREAELLTQLRHPAIVNYVAHGMTQEGVPFIAMEYVAGGTLEDALASGPLGARATARLARRVLEGLEHAHERGILHRDIKPANIMLPGGDPGQAKLLDFGIARHQFSAAKLTMTGAVMGTPMYMAPEQARGLRGLGPAADIFSLGAVLFESATGQVLFSGENMSVVLCKICLQEPAEFGERYQAIPQPLRDVLIRMVDKDPAARPSEARELLTEFAAMEDQLEEIRPLSAAPRRARRDSLSDREQRFVSLVLYKPPREEADGETDDDPAWPEELSATLPVDLPAVEGGNILRLVDGSAMVSFSSQGTPADRASLAARAALQLCHDVPGSSLAMGVGRSETTTGTKAGDLVEATAALLAAARSGTIVVDASTAHLLEARFELAALAGGNFSLLAEKRQTDAPRQVLGKAVPCIGRGREVAGLLAMFEQCASDQVACAEIVTGPAGAGKSRVAHEFLERLRIGGKEFRLLLGRGDPMRENVSLGLLGQAIRAAAGVGDGEPDEVQRQCLFDHLAPALPAASAAATVAFLGEIANVHFADDDLPQLRGARRDARMMADQTLAAWLDWLEAETRRAPVLMLLEDLHWGDFASVNYVDAALRVLRERPFMLLTLSRPEVDERFPGLWRERNLQRAPLAPLSQRAAQELVQRILGDIPPDQLLRMVEHSHGNPFYLEELARAVAAGEDLGRIPSTVLGMVQVRFDAAGEGAKRVLRAASVFGQRFQPAGVKALLGDMDQTDVDRWLDILSEQEILIPRPLGESRQYGFRHALFHQAAYAMLTPKDEVSGHYLAADFLEEQGERDAMVLADHFEKGEKAERAVRWIRVAANQALEVEDLKAALDRVERGVRLGAHGDDLAELRCVEAEARYWTGEYPEAERAAREARNCEDPKLALRAIDRLASALGPQAKYEEIAAIAKQLEDRPAQPELLNAWLRAKCDCAAYLASAGHSEERRRILALLELERERLDPILVGRIETTKAHLAHADGRPAEYAAGFARAGEFFERAGHRRAAVEALGNASIALMEVGQLEEAEEGMRRVSEIAERMGLRGTLAVVHYMLANILAYQGRLTEARVLGEQAVTLNSAMNDRYFGACSHAYLSMIEQMSDNHARAAEHARSALALLDNNPAHRPFALALLARALQSQGLAEEAHRCANDSYAELERLGEVFDGEAVIRLAYAESLLAVPDPAAAKEVLRKAVDRLRKQALTIDNPEWRQSFLTRIPEHRRILELANEIG